MLIHVDRKNWGWVVASVILCGLLLWVAAHSRDVKSVRGQFPVSTLEIAHADGRKTPLNIEIALTPEQQELGLMYRNALPKDSGMLFLWPEDQIISMWMKNTRIPLDMLFVARDGKIAKIIANAVPYDLTPLSSDAPQRAVIEINGGAAAENGIQVGDRVLFAAFGTLKN